MLAFVLFATLVHSIPTPLREVGIAANPEHSKHDAGLSYTPLSKEKPMVPYIYTPAGPIEPPTPQPHPTTVKYGSAAEEGPQEMCCEEGDP